MAAAAPAGRGKAPPFRRISLSIFNAIKCRPRGTARDTRTLTEMTNMMLKTAEPMTPDTPMSSLAKNTPMTTVASSGADDPAAMKVAPATSGESLSSAIGVESAPSHPRCDM